MKQDHRSKSISRKIWIPSILGIAVAMVYAIRSQIVSAFQDDSCLVISGMIADRVAQGDPITGELEKSTVTQLIHASVINGQIDEYGEPADYNGHPFQIEIASNRVTTSTTRSVFHPFKSEATVLIDR